jgi:hypothetical protein
MPENFLPEIGRHDLSAAQLARRLVLGAAIFAALMQETSSIALFLPWRDQKYPALRARSHCEECQSIDFARAVSSPRLPDFRPKQALAHHSKNGCDTLQLNQFL